MRRVDRWRTEWKICRHRKRNAFAVVQWQAAIYTRVMAAVEGDIDAQAGAGSRIAVDTDNPDGRPVDVGDAPELVEGNPLPFT